MDFELYTQISQYLHATPKERRKIPPGLARNKRTAFCLRAKKYSLVDGYLRRDGKIVLHNLNVTPVLRNLHRSTLSHRGNSNDLHQEARSQYFIEGDLRDVCRNVCLECIKCIEARMILSDEVPMRHLSSKTRERICRTIMTPVKKAKGNRSHKPRVPVFVAGKNLSPPKTAIVPTSTRTNPLRSKALALFLLVYWIAYITLLPGEKYSRTACNGP